MMSASSWQAKAMRSCSRCNLVVGSTRAFAISVSLGLFTAPLCHNRPKVSIKKIFGFTKYFLRSGPVCVTNGLVASDSINSGLFDAQVKGRVPTAIVSALDAAVRERQKLFPRASRADILREALAEYFANRQPREQSHV